MAFKIGNRVEFTGDYGKWTKSGDKGIVKSVRVGNPGASGCDWDKNLVEVTLDNGHVVTAFNGRMKLIKKEKLKVFTRLASVSAKQGVNRPIGPVMFQLMEEVGELSTEVAIKGGTKYRSPSEDGVVGEAVDVAIVALDVALLANGGNLEEIKEIFLKKLAKWESYATPQVGFD